MTDEEFLQKLKATFYLEAEEHLKSLTNGLLDLENDDLSQEKKQQTIEFIFREAHSLKGAARSVNETSIQDICQVMENVLSALKQNNLKTSQNLFNVLHETIDVITKALSGNLKNNQQDDIIEKLNLLLSPKVEEVQPSPPPEIIKEKKIPVPVKEEEKKVEEPKPKLPKKENPIKEEIITEKVKEKTIRISVAKIDRLFQETEEMLMVKLISNQGVVDLKSAYGKVNAFQKKLEQFLSELLLQNQEDQQQGMSRNIHQKLSQCLDLQQQSVKAFKESMTKLIKAAEQNSHFVNFLVDSLLDDVKKVLMQPLSTLFEVLPRMARDIAKDLGKEVVLETKGEDIEVDRRILEELKDPLIHIIRNAIDHGLETPSEREKKNKPPKGKIVIQAVESSGNHVEIIIADDGKGFDIEKLKKVTLKQDLVSEKELELLSDQDIIKLAFSSGVSTSPIITDLSGRGLGLGIVSEKVDQLGGQIFIESKQNQGTLFRLLVPQAMASFRGILITVANQEFIIPIHNIKRVIRLQSQDFKTIENFETVNFENHPISFVALSNLLGIREKQDKVNKNVFALIVKAEDKVIAFGVESIHREYEVLVKSLGKQCIRLKNIMASTIMEDGKVIPILNPVDLVRSAIKGGIVKVEVKKTKAKSDTKKNILIAEDSITTRLLLQNILESAGYNVKVASDGMEAFDLFQTQHIDLLLTDVEMPRMDGFSLTKKVRQTYKDLPIIICTSRGSNEDREKGIELGANAYLDKNNFTQASLLNIAQKLL